jgi:hypothetical protein
VQYLHLLPQTNATCVLNFHMVRVQTDLQFQLHVEYAVQDKFSNLFI